MKENRWSWTGVSFAAVAILLLSVVGCGDGQRRLPTYPVHGQVTVAGKPAVGVQIFLRRADGQAVAELPMNPHAITGPDGQFTMSTYDAEDGAPEGEYVAVLHWPTPERESTHDRLRGMFDKNKITVAVKAAVDNVVPPIPLPSADAEGKPIDSRPSLASGRGGI